MPTEITTAADLLDYPLGSTFTDREGDVWMIDTLGLRPDEEGPLLVGPETRGFSTAYVLKKWGPLTPQWRPDRPAQPHPSPYPPPGAGPCTCDWTSEDRGGGHFELVADYDPACPQHSVHVWSPRTQMWERTAQPTVQPSVAEIAQTIYDCLPRMTISRELAESVATKIAETIGGRTEAEVRAEALEEAAADIPSVYTRSVGNTPAKWLRARAAAIRGEQS